MPTLRRIRPRRGGTRSRQGGGTVNGMAPGLTFLDDDGTEVVLEAPEALALLEMTEGLEGATVSACAGCRSRVLAAVALVDVLDASAPHPRAGDLIDLADDAPTMHVYVVDDATECRHVRWRDPLAAEWQEVVDASGPHALR
jgi:hypothetical protein